MNPRLTFPDTDSVHTHPANSTVNSDILKSALQSGQKIRNKSDNMWTGESGYFQIRSRSKVVSSLLSNNKPIWRTRCRSNFFMAHALKTFYCRGALGTMVNLDTIGCMWIIRFEYANVWTGKVLNPERKSCRFKNIRILVDGP